MLPLILAAAGLLKGETIDKNKEMQQAKVQAATTRYSPWTGMHAAEPTRADPWGNAIAGASLGAVMDQNNEAFHSSEALKKSQTELNQRSRALPLSGTNDYGWQPNGFYGPGSSWSSMQNMSANNPYNGGYSLFK